VAILASHYCSWTLLGSTNLPKTVLVSNTFNSTSPRNQDRYTSNCAFSVVTQISLFLFYFPSLILRNFDAKETINLGRLILLIPNSQ
jgi:hypothetical protein